VTRDLLALDHDVRQVRPVYAKPFRQTHKNDFSRCACGRCRATPHDAVRTAENR
jgi:hypothetical protein